MAQTRFQQDLGQWLLGFFGALFAVAILPRGIMYLVRRVFGRAILEIVAFGLLGYVIDRLGGRARLRR